MVGFWWGRERNTIYLNQNLRTTASPAALAATIAHEATHADYDYNPERAIDATLQRHPELTRDDINIYRDTTGSEYTFSLYDPETQSFQSQVFLLNSIDQEYTSFSNELAVWQELKGSQEDLYLDYDLALYNQGEAVLKANLRTRGSYKELPEY